MSSEVWKITQLASSVLNLMIFSCSAGSLRSIASWHEVRVLRVPSLAGGGMVGELRPQLVGERPGTNLQAGLCADLLQQPLAV